MLFEEMLERFWDRAPIYDRENRFFTEDFEELRKAGYLTCTVPNEFGGAGFNLAQFCLQQRKLAYYAAPTALGVNMHLMWVGVAADLWRSGDKSLEWMLRGAMSGNVYAAGHAESGNDFPVLLSTTNSERVDGGYRFNGRKSFGTLTPVWTHLGIHGLDKSASKIIHAFMPRNTQGSSIVETWDVLGMRATKSDDTVLHDVFVPDQFVARVVEAGPAGVDQYILNIFAWCLMGFGNIYYGLARRAFDLVVASIKNKSSVALSRSMAYHAEVEHDVAEMGMALEGIEPHLDRVAEEWSTGKNYGALWPMKIVAAKQRAVEEGWRVVDLAMDVAGGFGIFKKAGLERLWRDARLGRMHPANSMLTREIVAKTALGIGLDEQPRWG